MQSKEVIRIGVTGHRIAAGGFNYPGSILQMKRNYGLRINYEF